jgi:signal transduction histidine kinase
MSLIVGVFPSRTSRASRTALLRTRRTSCEPCGHTLATTSRTDTHHPVAVRPGLDAEHDFAAALAALAGVLLVMSTRPWTSAALLGFVILTIAALMFVPIAADRYTRPLVDEMRTVIEPGRGLVTELQLALALEGSILHDFFDTGDTLLIGHYRAARQRESIANARLARLTGRLGADVQRQFDVLRDLERQWHALVEHVLVPGSGTVAMSDPLQAQRFEDVLVAVAQLGDVLEKATRERRQQILKAEYLQRQITLVLGIAAFAALAAVIALGVRLEHQVEATRRGRIALERAMDSKARLMRGVSHDLKNPLNAIEGHAALLDDGVLGDLTEQQRGSVRRIRSGVRSILVLLRDLLDLSRAEGDLRIEAQTIDLRDVVRDVVDEHRGAAQVAGHTIGLSFSGDLGAVRTDAARVRQILGNLLSNAIKYTPSGGHIEVRGERREASWAGGSTPSIAIDVADSGPGIPSDKLELVFEEFARLDPGGKPGSGLGLAIARRIARLLDGDITVTSEVGRGSCFTLWLGTVDA